MPNRKTHQRITATIAVAAAPLALVAPVDVFILIETGIAITLFPAMTPDLDINTRRFGAWGEFIGLKAYAKSITHRYGLKKRHWSRARIWDIFWMSHIPFAGTLLRTLMLAAPIALATVVLGLDFKWAFWGLLWIWAGMGISDCGHILADSPWKKRERILRKDDWIRKGYRR